MKEVQRKAIDQSSSSGTSLAAELDEAATSGNRLISYVETDKDSGEVPTPSEGWTLIDGDNSSSVSIAVAERVADGSEKDDCTWTWSTSRTSAGWIIEIGELPENVSVKSGSNFTDESSVDEVALGPIEAPGAGLAIGGVAVDTLDNWDPVGWSNGFEGEDIGLGSTGLSVATKAVEAKASVSTTASSAGSTDQASGILILITEEAGPEAPTVLSRWAGGVTDDEVTVAVRVSAGESVRLAVDTDSELGSPVYSEAKAPNGVGLVRLAVSGLDPDTAYHYGIEVDSELLEDGRGQFTTMATAAETFSFAWGSCRLSDQDSEVFDAIRQSGARFFIQAGDFHYDDIAENDDAKYRAAYAEDILAQARIQALMAAMPVDYTWGDHDYARNDAIGSESGGESAQTLYREQVPHYAIPAEGPIYHTFACGRCRFIVLDVQSDRTEAEKAGSVLGEAQKAWLKEVLEANDEPVVFLVSHNTWNDPPPGTADNGWGYFEDEVDELVEWFEKTGNDRRLYWLCGDAHMVAADDGTNAPGGMPVAQGAALDQSGSEKGGTFSEGTKQGGEGTAGQYGFITVTDDGGSVKVSYEGRDAEGTAHVTMETVFPIQASASGQGTGTGSASATVTRKAAAAGAGEGTGAASASRTRVASASGSGEGTGSASAQVVGDEPTPSARVVSEPVDDTLYVEPRHADGSTSRWAGDEPDAAGIPENIDISDGAPGGHRAASFSLKRDPRRDWPDLDLVDDVVIRGRTSPLGRSAFEGQLAHFPSELGDGVSIGVNAVGHQVLLSENEAWQALYVALGVDGWGDAPLARREQIADDGWSQGKIPLSTADGGLVWDIPAGQPLAANEVTEAHFQLPAGVKAARFGYRGKRKGNWGPMESAKLRKSDAEDHSGAEEVALTLNNTPNVTAEFTPRRYLALRARVTSETTPGPGRQQSYDRLAVYGDNDIELREIEDELPGVYAHDVLPHMLDTGAPHLNYTVGAGGTIVPNTGFVIPDLAFLDRGTVGDGIQKLNAYFLNNYAVWDRKEFHWHPWDPNRLTWRATIAGGAHWSPAGRQAETLLNGMLVDFTDAEGRSLTAGPPGSGCDFESALLQDTDLRNPYTRRGRKRWGVLGVDFPLAFGSTAIQVGHVKLLEHRLPQRSGTLVIRPLGEGHVPQLEHPTMGPMPIWAARSGDYIELDGWPEPEPFRIVEKPSYQHEAKMLTLQLDTASSRMSAILERVGVRLKGVISR